MARFEGTIFNDIINGTALADRVEGKAGNDQIYGWGGNDLLKGDEGNDFISGGGGNDVMNGDDGDDRLFGNSGNDVLEGGLGNDRLTGGTGADTFVFGDVGGGRDFITDFADGVDRIAFDLDTVNSMADLTITQLSSGNTLVAWDTGSVVVVGITAADLSSADFIF